MHIQIVVKTVNFVLIPGTNHKDTQNWSCKYLILSEIRPSLTTSERTENTNQNNTT